MGSLILEKKMIDPVISYLALASTPPGIIFTVWQKCYDGQLFYLSRTVSGNEGQENKSTWHCQSHHEGRFHLLLKISNSSCMQHYYNATKFGVDIMDQMARKYSVKSASRCWHVHVFFNVLDLACINEWILYKEVTARKIKRRKLILELCKELQAVHMAN
ncbi:hypothetical protein PR048_009722 [Dryococelus australis]|uniref:PiggyBac transposable element-derived protein domain-containing protein n=1 Tax=Dryococelus australis TaxID=614101 RepID=A0ABQ9I1N6_9NEOP|nr:hypothetical protein PR048_009722 [Dryococelus australis]